MIFVFGSNEAGIHGAGAAKFALDNAGAEWGTGFGLRGRSYAIPTKDDKIRTLPLGEINKYFEVFISDLTQEPFSSMNFDLTPIGCGLAGYTKKQMMREVILKHTLPDNLYFNRRWFQE